jgi:hypothetical protein
MRVYVYGIYRGKETRKPIAVVEADNVDHAEQVFAEMRAQTRGRYSPGLGFNRERNNHLKKYVESEPLDYDGFCYVEERVDPVGSMILECLNA